MRHRHKPPRSVGRHRCAQSVCSEGFSNGDSLGRYTRSHATVSVTPDTPSAKNRNSPGLRARQLVRHRRHHAWIRQLTGRHGSARNINDDRSDHHMAQIWWIVVARPCREIRPASNPPSSPSIDPRWTKHQIIRPSAANDWHTAIEPSGKLQREVAGRKVLAAIRAVDLRGREGTTYALEPVLCSVREGTASLTKNRSLDGGELRGPGCDAVFMRRLGPGHMLPKRNPRWAARTSAAYGIEASPNCFVIRDPVYRVGSGYNSAKPI